MIERRILVENLNSKDLENRLFTNLSSVLDTSLVKFKMEKKKDADRRSWGRLALQCIQLWGQLKHDSELQELRTRIERLEE